jgi:polyisoprenoid-binding protein YceI
MKSTPLFVLSLFLSGALHAADVVRYEAQPGGGKITLEGKSTAHGWKVETTAIGGYLEADASFPESTAGSTKPKVEITVPVRQLKSGSKAMDVRMMSEMIQPTYPKITYRVLELKPKGTPSGGKAEFDAVGALTALAVTRTNTMPVVVTRVDKTKLTVTGTLQLKMSDFGIKPPVFDVPILGGIMKTDDDMKLSFEWSPEVEKK